MFRIARILELVLGTIFILSAVAKALDVQSFAVQISYYNVLRDPAALVPVAYAAIVLEAALGAALLGGIRLGGLVLALTAALLVGFSVLIAYAWMFHNLADCGCFGEYVKMGPAASIAKNIVLLVFAIASWRGTRPGAAAEAAAIAARARRRWALSVVALILVGVAFALGKPAEAPAPVSSNDGNPAQTKDKPFAKFKPQLDGEIVDLSNGEYLVAMLSATCEHCQAAVEPLNELAQTPELPRVVGLLMGSEEEVRKFLFTTGADFPTQTLNVLEFMNMIGAAPPRFYIVRNGAEVRHWDPVDASGAPMDVTYDQVLEFATEDTPAQPATPPNGKETSTDAASPPTDRS